MSIDMTTVKQIMHNNKEVSKIEDTNGNVLWQKPLIRNKLYYFNGADISEYDFENKTITAYTAKSGSASLVGAGLSGSFIFGYNGDLYCGTVTSSVQNIFKLELDTVNQEYNFTDMSATLPAINGNCSFRDGNNIIWTTASDTGNINSWPDGQVIGTYGGGLSGNNVLKYDNKIYAFRASTYMYEYNNGTYTQTSHSTPGGNNPAYQVWFLNGTMYYMNTKEYDSDNNTWPTKTWSGGMGSFNGSRVFTDGIDIYQVGGTGTNKNIWKLDVATSTWSTYWTVPTAIRGDYFFNTKGTAQLGQNLRPRN